MDQAHDMLHLHLCVLTELQSRLLVHLNYLVLFTIDSLDWNDHVNYIRLQTPLLPEAAAALWSTTDWLTRVLHDYNLTGPWIRKSCMELNDYQKKLFERVQRRVVEIIIFLNLQLQKSITSIVITHRIRQKRHAFRYFFKSNKLSKFASQSPTRHPNCSQTLRKHKHITYFKTNSSVFYYRSCNM